MPVKVINKTFQSAVQTDGTNIGLYIKTLHLQVSSCFLYFLTTPR